MKKNTLSNSLKKSYLLTLLLGLFIMLSSYGQCPPFTTISQTNGDTGSSAASIGQSFEAPTTGDLVEVAAGFRKNETPAVTDLILNIYSGAGTGGAVLQSQSINVSTIPESGVAILSFPLTTAVPVVLGSTYTMEFVTTSGTLNPIVNNVNIYSDGTHFTNGTAVPTEDLVFEADICPGSAAPLDTDDDGVPDTVDLDDDNDGILDRVECANPLEIQIVIPDNFQNAATNMTDEFTNNSPALSNITLETNTSVLQNSTFYDNQDVVVVAATDAGVSAADLAGLVTEINSTDANSPSTYLILLDFFNASNRTRGVTFLNNLRGASYTLGANYLTIQADLNPTATFAPQFAGLDPYTAAVGRGITGVATEDVLYFINNSGSTDAQSLMFEINGKTVFFATDFSSFQDFNNAAITGTAYENNENKFGPVFADLASLATCPNTDGLGGVDALDTDSDEDGCSDANEAYVDFNADGGDGGVYNPGNANAEPFSLAAGTVNADGTVVGASYPGTNASVTDASSSVVCLDTDGDGVGDIADLDDDNDGILDSVEAECTTITDGVFDWDVDFSNQIGTGQENNIQNNLPLVSNIVDGRTLTVTLSDPNNDISELSIIQSFGNTFGRVFEIEHATGQIGGSTTTFTFNDAVQNVNFEMVDIDTNTGSFEDLLVINAKRPDGSIIEIVAANIATQGNHVLFEGSNTFRGDAAQGNATDNDQGGRMVLNFNEPILSIDFTYLMWIASVIHRNV